MSKDEVISNLQESVTDILKNLTAVKGGAFADTVQFAHMGLHFARLMSQIAGANGIPENQREIMFHQHSQLVQAGLSTISDAHGMSSATVDEILDWASKIDDKIDQATEQLSQEN
jgi:hypothetical protein